MLLKRETIVSGEQLTDASSGFSQGEPSVSVTLDARGASRMLETTRANLGRPMAVVFIEKKRLAEDQPCKGTRSGIECTQEEVINIATIRGVFSSNFQITGVMANEARELALLLRAGSLAAPLYIVEQRTVGPSLGADNIQRGVNALIRRPPTSSTSARRSAASWGCASSSTTTRSTSGRASTTTRPTGSCGSSRGATRSPRRTPSRSTSTRTATGAPAWCCR